MRKLALLIAVLLMSLVGVGCPSTDTGSAVNPHLLAIQKTMANCSFKLRKDLQTGQNDFSLLACLSCLNDWCWREGGVENSDCYDLDCDQVIMICECEDMYEFFFVRAARCSNRGLRRS